MTSELPTISLRAGRHKRVRTGHPWVFSNEIEMPAETKALPPGTQARFVDASGNTLGTGFFNPHSLIACRMVSETSEAIDQKLIERRLRQALKLRQRFFTGSCYRLVHSEADALPGLIVDRYGDILVVQLNSAGMELIADQVIAALRAVIDPAAILLRNESPVRRLEGLEPETRWDGAPAPAPHEVMENRSIFRIDLSEGQKTGWFFDQAGNRAMMTGLAHGTRVLDLYCYLGGFAIQAAKGGAKSVTAIDRSEGALDLARQSADLNGVADLCDFRRATVFDATAEMAESDQKFDIVIADPPAFVKARKDIKVGARGYRKLARLSAALVAPGGLLFIASCSHHVAPALFAEQVTRGISDAGRRGAIVHSGGAGPDHPIHPMLPESAYLKCLLFALD